VAAPSHTFISIAWYCSIALDSSVRASFRRPVMAKKWKGCNGKAPEARLRIVVARVESPTGSCVEHHLAQPMRTWITSDSGCSTA